MNWRKFRQWLIAYWLFGGGFLLLTPAAVAQFTTVSGTVTDPNGLPYAGGTIVPTLVSSGASTLNGQSYTPPAQPVGLSATGSFIMQLADNTLLSPAGTIWNFLVCSGTGAVLPSFGKGSVCFSVTGITISGSAQNIGATLSAAALALTSNFGGSGLPTGCSSGQLPQWNGTTWVCASGGTGTVTSSAPTINFLPRFQSATNLTNSLLEESFPSSGNEMGIGLSTTQNTANALSIASTITSTLAPNCDFGAGSTFPLLTGSPCFGENIFVTDLTARPTGVSTALQAVGHTENNVNVGILGSATAPAAGGSEQRGIEADADTNGSLGTNRALVGWAGSPSGPTTTQEGLYLATLAPSGGGTVTNNYGAYIEAPVFQGTGGIITHNYGLYIADQTATTGGGTNSDPHAIFTAGTAPSTLGGALTITGNLNTNVTGSTQCLHVNSVGLVSGAGADCATAGTITAGLEAGGNASNAQTSYLFTYNTAQISNADRCQAWATAIATVFNGVTGYTYDARPEIATNINCASNALSGTDGGTLLLPPGTINIATGQFIPANTNGLHVLGEGNSGVTAYKACASGHNGCSADQTLNPAGAVTAVIGMGPTTPASSQDVVGSSFERAQIDANGVAGVMGAAVTAGQEMTEFQHLNIKNSALVQFDIGEGTNSVQNGVDLHDFYFLENPSQAVYNPCPTAVTEGISTISNTTGGVATVTLAGSPTPPLTQFGEVNITGQSNGATHGTVYNGLREIASVISSTSFTFNVASNGLADSATGNGTVQAGPIGIRYFTSPNGGGRPIWNGTIVAAGCNSTGTNPLAQLTASGGPLWAGHIHMEDAMYGAAIGVDGNTKDVTLEHFSPVTNVTNGVLISNQWTTTNVDINHLITTQGGGIPNTTSLIDQINGNTLTPTNNGHLPHYWIDSATGVFTTANPVAGTEVANGVDIFNDTISIFNGGAVGFSATKAGVVTAAGSGTFSGGVSTGAVVPAANTITGIAFVDDTNGNKGIGLTATGSAVDYLNITNGVAGSPGVVSLGGAGADANITTNITSKGSGAIHFNGAGLPLTLLATQAANTVVANVSGSTVAPTAVAIPSGIQNYLAGTGYNQATSHQTTTSLNCVDSSGSGTAQVCNTSPSFVPVANDCIIYTTTTANTGTGLTLNVNSLGAKSVAKWQGTTTLVANDVQANKQVPACYDGTNWELTTIGNAPGGAATISPINLGQNASNQVWFQPPIPTFTGSDSTTGGSLNCTSPHYMQVVYNSALGSTIPGIEIANTNSAYFSPHNCTSGATGSITINAITLPSGYTSWTMYEATSSGGEQIVAACTNIASGSGCTITTDGSGAAPPTVNTSILQPANVQATRCPPSVLPSMFGPDSSGNFETWAGADVTTNNGFTSGFWDVCIPTRFTDEQATPPAGNNAFTLIDHRFGVNTSTANQDRTLWVGGQTQGYPTGNADTGSHYALEGVQSELDVAAGAGFSITGAPDGEISDGSFNTTDWSNSTYANPNSLGVNSIRASLFKQGTGGATQYNVLNAQLSFSNTMQAGTTGSAIRASCATTSTYGTNLTCYGLNYTFNAQTTALQAAININGTTPGGSNNYLILNRVPGLQNGLNGPVILSQLVNNNVAALSVNASQNVIGSSTISQAAISPPGSIGCSGGSSTYGYELVGVDNNGGQVASSQTSSAASCVNPLTSGNPATVNLPSAWTGGATYSQPGQFVRIDVYRTSGPMATGKVGSLSCSPSTGYAGITCTSFSDTGLSASGSAPTANTTGSLSIAGLAQEQSQCKVTAAVNMTASGTAVNFCTWNLPSAAQTWAWQCSGTYTTTTSSDTFAIGMNASQTPTSETGNAIIYTTLTGTSTAGSATATISGNQNILTGASVSSATNEPFSVSGTIQASATSGTFALSGTLTGTSPSGSVNPGTTCRLY